MVLKRQQTQTAWVVAATEVGQSHVTLNLITLTLIGSDKSHFFIDLGTKRSK